LISGFIHNELREYHYHDIVNQLLALPALHIFFATGLTMLSYMIMMGYDILVMNKPDAH
jgi:phosphatidylglycerol lysyltransferase